MFVKSNMETYITICKIDRQQEFAVWLRKLEQGLGWLYQPRVWDGEGDGREVQKGDDICVPVADSMLRFDRNQQNSVKQLSSNKK